jgi:CheY-like chemotaxis protein
MNVFAWLGASEDRRTFPKALTNVPAGTARPDDTPPGDFVQIAVIDDGHGMPPEVLCRATAPMFTTKAADKGTGLGLPMVLAFAQSSGGQLRIDSTPDEGTRVEIWLPRMGDSVEAEGATADCHGREAPPPTRAERATLLYVEDDDLARLALARMLREANYQVVEATGPDVALALTYAVPKLDAVILSLPTPDANSMALLRRLRQQHPRVPAVVLATRPPRHAQQGVPVLLKPVNNDELLAALDEQIINGRVMDPVDTSYLDRLIVRMRSPALLAALASWRDARGEHYLPTTAALKRMTAASEDWSFIVEPSGSEDAPAFRFVSIGPGLERQLGRTLSGQTLDGCDAGELVAMSAAYRRALRTGLPSYEFARYGLHDGPPVLFERLILPTSVAGRAVTHLLGLASFSNLAPMVPESPQ